MAGKNKFPPINIHPLLGILFVISLLTGTFTQLFTIFFIVCVHELGHVLMALMFRWRIESVTLSFFGGVMQTSEDMNRTWLEQFIVILAGPFQHVGLFILFYSLENTGMITATFAAEAQYFNMLLFFFNLLPIFPLDGGKLVFLLSTLIMPYKRAFESMIVFSIIMTVVVLFVQVVYLPYHLTVLFIWLFLFHENFLDWKYRMYHFVQFLLQRKEGNFYHVKTDVMQVHEGTTLHHVFKSLFRYKKYEVQLDKGKRIKEERLLQYFFLTGNRNEKIQNILHE